MKIQFMSDLHREMGASQYPFLPSGDIVVLAGDVVTSKTKKLLLDEFGNLDKPVIYVPGNHDFYGGNFDTAISNMRAMYDFLPRRIHVLSDDHLVVGDVHFLGATLWPRIKVSEEMVVRNGISDFISYRGFPLIEDISVENIGLAHDLSVEYLDLMMGEIRSKNPNAKIVVVTHFPPSYQAQEERFRESNLSSYFYNELDWLIEKHQPDYWIYGHTHGNLEWEHGKTKVVTNQFGYLNREMQESFNINRTVEI